jgi:zinc transport system ATP-binding protein
MFGKEFSPMSVIQNHRDFGSQHNPEQPVICFKNVSFCYGVNRTLIDADFDIYKGESVCVVGPNGGGKSTLLKLMLGLLKPNTGSIHLFGDTPKRTRSRVGYVPQSIEFDRLFPVTSLDVVLMGQLHRNSFGFRSPEGKKRARKALETMGGKKLENVPFANLSGGQRQAVLIARALAGDPDLLLFDEPTAHVDIAAEKRLRKVIEGLNQKLTVITVSHDLNLVSKAVTKVICVNRSVHAHPTVELTETDLRKLYGTNVRMIQHNYEHSDSHGGHKHG